MENFYFFLTLVFVFSFWAYDGYKLLMFYSAIEEAKRWDKRKAKLVGIESANLKSKPSRNVVSRFFRTVFFPEKFNFFAYFYEGDIKVGAFNFSLYPKHTRHISFFARKILRSDPEHVEIYVNPRKVSENILIPASEHKIIGKIVWFGIKTFCLTFLMLYLFF